MRHARKTVRLSRTSSHQRAMMSNMVRNIVQYGQVRTTVTKAKQASRVMDRLITWGKDGSVHARRQAYSLLKDRDMVKRLFAVVAPEFVAVRGGYTRVLKLAPRNGDGASLALLELTRRPAEASPATPAAKAQRAPAPAPAASPEAPASTEATPAKPKRFFEGLRTLFGPKDKGRSSSP